MTACRDCGEPITPCGIRGLCLGYGYVHEATGSHFCLGTITGGMPLARPADPAAAPAAAREVA